MNTSEVLLHKLTRREFRQRMESGQLKACIIPIAAVEQHLEHLQMEHDWRSVTHVAEQVARDLSPSVLVAQGVMAGISEHHMTHKGTLTLRPGTFIAVLTDLIRSVIHGGFHNVLVLNGHGGNVQPCQAVWDQLVREFQVNLQFMSYWDVFTVDDTDLLKSGRRLPEDLPGHAQEFETSVALAVFPENVRHDAMHDQSDATPAMATAETGQEYLIRIVTRVSRHLHQMIDGTSAIPVPPFHP